MDVRHLGHTDFDTIMVSFLSAFENYFVTMPTDYNYYKQRWNAAKVDFNCSYGMFDKNQLVGFIIHAIDSRDGNYIAFNTGTGVIPEYRGRNIVNTIYEYAIPELIRHGITKSVLEVITKNERAIKAYNRVGFKICKNFECFSGALCVKNDIQTQLEDISFDNVSWQDIPNQDKYSWDFHHRSLKSTDSKYFNVYHNGRIESFFSLKPDGTINQLEVFNTADGNWKRLFSAIQSIKKQVRIINVDDRCILKLNAIADAGLKSTVNQYEMELSLK